MITCRICQRQVALGYIKFPDLCEPCGLRTERVMYGMYIVCKGKKHVKFDIKNVEEFIKDRTTKELEFLAGEVKATRSIV